MNQLLVLPVVLTFRPNGREPTITRPSALLLWKWRAGEIVEMSKPDLSPIPPTLGNPAQNAGFPHSHRAGDGGPLSHPTAKSRQNRGVLQILAQNRKKSMPFGGKRGL